MKDIERRRYETFLRVREFITGRAAQFPPTTLAGELLTRLNAVINEMETHTTAQSSGRSATLQSSTSKAAARDELRRDLDAISRTARVMALSTPGLEDKFRAPRSVSDQALLATARAFAADALPLKAEFARRGLPDDFLDDLNSDIEEFEQTNTQKIQKRESQVAATAAIDSALERGINVVRELDAIMRNQFANDPASLASWLSASHTERSPRRAPANTSTTPPAPTPTPK
jgi:uncharacterized phage infection (PIP) family protein YhgE